MNYKTIHIILFAVFNTFAFCSVAAERIEHRLVIPGGPGSSSDDSSTGNALETARNKIWAAERIKEAELIENARKLESERTTSTSEKIIEIDKKTYPFISSKTYTSTYRNTTKDNALRTVQEERAKHEPGVGAFAKSWKVTAVTQPICGQDGLKGEYWICEITVTYAGESYISRNQKTTPSRAADR